MKWTQRKTKEEDGEKKGSLENGKSSNVVNCSKEVHSEKSWFLSGNKDYQLKGR